MILYKANDLNAILDKLRASYIEKIEDYKQQEMYDYMRQYQDMLFAISDVRFELIDLLGTNTIQIQGLDNE